MIKVIIEIGDVCTLGIYSDSTLVSVDNFVADRDLLDKIYAKINDLGADSLVCILKTTFSDKLSSGTYVVSKFGIKGVLFYSLASKLDVNKILNLARLSGIVDVKFIDKIGYCLFTGIKNACYVYKLKEAYTVVYVNDTIEYGTVVSESDLRSTLSSIRSQYSCDNFISLDEWVSQEFVGYNSVYAIINSINLYASSEISKKFILSLEDIPVEELTDISQVEVEKVIHNCTDESEEVELDLIDNIDVAVTEDLLEEYSEEYVEDLSKIDTITSKFAVKAVLTVILLSLLGLVAYSVFLMEELTKQYSDYSVKISVNSVDTQTVLDTLKLTQNYSDVLSKESILDDYKSIRKVTKRKEEKFVVTPMSYKVYYIINDVDSANKTLNSLSSKFTVIDCTEITENEEFNTEKLVYCMEIQRN